MTHVLLITVCMIVFALPHGRISWLTIYKLHYIY